MRPPLVEVPIMMVTPQTQPSEGALSKGNGPSDTVLPNPALVFSAQKTNPGDKLHVDSVDPGGTVPQKIKTKTKSGTAGAQSQAKGTQKQHAQRAGSHAAHIPRS
ncbi:unnamed protein product [Linum trigynum]|uniref:Uncharacterized protein n=1 Tax=Linum trigynum TaxID=586398 RepID=A0AAV2F8C6_9ROSI